ncbi:putative outer membrane starch-binding protein [Arcticibacter pallidicorallinus]|uniref:Putative outer membrane starch-binding protein n=1 Tax=Arcticibacter pallidicorallinus TaxID=1259464 RepID=A0A2T0TX97_9SPHI|nr:RagB/SusD family nutrient uptake outer membrane protein [Arcticibacter pallidicorallinus]PRY50285.1 putative outer membrane starch-binding protein [Arcticibacter pallidicorallinus]
MILKSTRKYISLLIVLLVSFSSCKKLDDVNPTDTIDPSKAFRNVKDLDLGLLGTYAYLDYSLIGSNAIVSDEITVPDENTVSNTEAYRWLYNSGSGSVTSAFNDYYIAIDRLNRVLAAIPAVEAVGADLTLKQRYQGELLALRAYCHLELLRAYASSYDNGALGVPYMKSSIISYPARDKFEAVIANIKADLIEAKDLIPASFNDRTRITRTAVAAIQARTALYERNWAEAVSYSTEVINAVPLASRTQFPQIWTDQSDAEVIWKLKRVGSDSRIGAFFFRETGGLVLYAPSFELINSFDQANDIRYSSYITYSPNRGAGKSAYLVKKYIGGDAAAPGRADVKLFRTAEMYLIRAEAEAELAPQAAGADLNTLRSARIQNYASETFAGKEALITAIYQERFKDLAFEGHRFFDLRRRKLPVERLPQDAVNAVGAVKLEPTQAQYAFPIPAREISVNRNMEQNPNY